MLAVFLLLFFFFVFFPALTLLFSLPPSIHAGQLEKGDPMDQGHYQRAQVVKRTYKKSRPVRTLAHVDRAAVWVENFVGEKFCDTWVNHKNYNPTKITRYTVCRCIWNNTYL